MSPQKKAPAFFLLLSSLLLSGIQPGESVTFYVTNMCPFPIWPGTASNTELPLVAGGGFFLAPGQTKREHASSSWKGRIWARTSCDFTRAAAAACETGDCAGKLACNGTIGLPPATLVEFSLEPDPTKSSFYDVSLVDGYNLPVAVSPSKGGKPQLPSNCTINGCSKSLTSGSNCPLELQVVSADKGEVVACKSACLAFGLDVFCCRNEYGTPDKCRPSIYSKIFKEACPSYFSYAYDGAPLTPLRSCWSDEYTITFCPSRWAADA
ncbi:unnamed protein product [Victoria cruziana]